MVVGEYTGDPGPPPMPHVSGARPVEVSPGLGSVARTREVLGRTPTLLPEVLVSVRAQ